MPQRRTAFVVAVFVVLGAVEALAMSKFLDLRPTRASDLEAIVDLETASYPADEAASADTLRSRFETAGDYFRTMVLTEDEKEEVVGFLCGTRCHELDEASMRTHDPTGKILGVHSVVVAAAQRRSGFASLALKWYVDEMRPLVEEIRLIAKAELLSLYCDKVGFRCLGLSSVVHGADPWFDCSLHGADMVQVDAFAAGPFSGNPAAVVFAHGSSSWMQRVANENNLAETAFLRKLPGKDTYHIRWFTPESEVDLCGHATLAAAYALFRTGRVPSDDAETTITLQTRNAGALLVTKSQDSDWLTMDLPTSDLAPVSSVPPALREAVCRGGVEILYCGRGSATVPDWFVEVSDFSADIDVDALRGNGDDFDVPRGVILTKRGDGSPYDFESRFFAPGESIPEDPVTGSAHTLLTKYWEAKLHKSPLLARQASPRGGVLKVHTTAQGRTIVQGQAARVLTATLLARDD